MGQTGCPTPPPDTFVMHPPHICRGCILFRPTEGIRTPSICKFAQISARKQRQRHGCAGRVVMRRQRAGWSAERFLRQRARRRLAAAVFLMSVAEEASVGGRGPVERAGRSDGRVAGAWLGLAVSAGCCVSALCSPRVSLRSAGWLVVGFSCWSRQRHPVWSPSRLSGMEGT